MHDYAGAHEVTVPVAPGDTLLIYTDGVTDTPGAAGASARRAWSRPWTPRRRTPARWWRPSRAELDAFARGTALDDRAMLALQRAA